MCDCYCSMRSRHNWLLQKEHPSRTVETFGLAGLVAVAAFVLGAVFALNGLLFLSGVWAAANFAGAVAAGVTGMWFWRKQKPGEAGSELPKMST